MKKSYLILLAAGMLGLSACQNEPFMPTTPKEIAEDINSLFDFNSHNSPTITVKAGRLAYIRVYDADPTVNEKTNPIVGFMTDYYGNYTGKMEVGSALFNKELYAVSTDGELKMTAKLTKKGITFVNTDDRNAGSRAAYIPDNHKRVCSVLDDYFHTLLPSGNNQNLDVVQDKCTDINIHTTSDNTEIAVSMVDYGDHFKNQLYYYYIPDDGQDVTKHYNPKEFYELFVDPNVCQKFRAYPATKCNGDPLEWCYISNNKEGRDSNRRTPIPSEQCEFGATTHLKYYGANYNPDEVNTTEFPAGVTVGFFMRIWVYDNIFPAGRNVPMGYYLIFTDGVGSYYEDLNCPQKSGWMPFSRDFKSCTNSDWTWARGIYNFNRPASNDFYHFAAFQANEGPTWPTEIDGAFSCPYHPGKTVSRIMYGVEDSLGYIDDSDFDDVMFLVTVEGGIGDNIPKFPESSYDEMYWYGTYCFEDLYPLQGDYDLNDVVVRYSFKLTYTKTEFMDEPTIYTANTFSARFEPYHNGAKYINDFYMAYTKPDGTFIGPICIYENNKQMAGHLVVNSMASWHVVDPSIPNAGYADYSNKTGLSNYTGMFCRDMLTYLKENEWEPGSVFNFKVREGDVDINRGLNPFILSHQPNNEKRQIHLSRFEYVPMTGCIEPENEYQRLYTVNVHDGANSLGNMPYAADIASRSDYKPAPEKMPIFIAYPLFQAWAESFDRDNTHWTDVPTTKPWVDLGPIE